MKSLPTLKPARWCSAFCGRLDEPQALEPALTQGLTTFAMELIPRITRAQAMDALSSMATVAGYKAVLIGASQIPRMFPLLMTAAGTVPPARVLVLGAGVAGCRRSPRRGDSVRWLKDTTCARLRVNRCVRLAQSFWKWIWVESKLKTLAVMRWSYRKKR